MKAIKNSIPLHIYQRNTFTVEIERFLFDFIGVGSKCWEFIGSFGKKEYCSDVDIAIDEYSIDLESARIKLIELGLEVKVYKGFNELSFGFEFNKSIIQVDLMFTKNLNWSQFIYYSPNLMNGESKYKGIYRNLLLSALLITESRFVVDENNCKQLILRLNEGLFRVHKSFIDIYGKKVNFSRIVEEQFITNDPMTFTKMLNLEGLCLTFEEVWDQVTHREKFQEIKDRFIKFCKKSKITIPTEIEKYGSSKEND